MAPNTGAASFDNLNVCKTALNSKTLILTNAEIAGIFAGTITNWNNSAIVASNPQYNVKVTVPKTAAAGSRAETFTTGVINCLNYLTAEPIKLYDRAAGSGTTFILRDYLNGVASSTFTYPSSDNFTAATADESNSTGVAGAVSANDGGFGYVEQGYAIQNSNSVQVARIEVGSKIIALSAGSVTAAANLGLNAINANNACGGFSTDQPTTYVAANVNTACFTLDNAGGGAYPIVGVSYAILKKSQSSQAAGESAVKFLEYLTQTGQSLATANYYVPLPKTIQALAFSLLETVKVPNGAGAPVQAVSTSL